MKNSSRLKQLCFTLLISAVILGCSKDADPDPVTTLTSCIELPETSPKAREVVMFTSCSDFATSYLWEFGDGTTSTLENPEHTYASAGNFTVKLTVKDDKNGTHTSTKTLEVLAGETSDCQIHYGGFLTQSQTWSKGCHIVQGRIQIEEGATLTIEPGAVVKFKEAGRITVGYAEPGTIIAEGTEAEPIRFTSYQEIPAPGDWDSFAVYGFTETPSSFKYCVFEYGGFDLFEDPTAMISVHEGGRVIIDHCEFSKSYSYAVSADRDGGFELFTNNYIHDIEDFAMYISGNYAGTIGEGNIIENKGVLIGLYQVTKDAEWRGLTCPYVTESNLWVGSDVGNTLTLGPGVRIEFQGTQMLLPNYSTSIATLITNGTAENPVVFTAHDPAATSRWGGMVLSSNFTPETYFRHTIFEKAQNNSENNGVISVGATTLNMENCSISGAKQFGIIMNTDAKLGVFSNNDFGEIGSYSIYLQVQNLEKIGDGNTFSGNKDVYTVIHSLLTDVTFPALSVNYYRPGDMYIGSPAGNTVTFEPGAKFRIYNGTLIIGEGYNALDPMPGTLVAIGTPENPIIIKREMGEALGNSDLVEFSGEHVGTGSIMEYCHIIGASIGIRVSNMYNDELNPFPTIRNNTISECSTYPIYVANSYPLIEDNNTYVNNAFNGVHYME